MSRLIFIIPRTPVSHRTPLRDELWTLCKKTLVEQYSKNWKAIVVGDSSGEALDPEHFIILDRDTGAKTEKIATALQYIASELIEKPNYLVRLDDDDLFSPQFLDDMTKDAFDFDCYADKRQVCIDLAHLRISFGKRNWLPNTIVHRYDHAIQPCGPKNIQLILQNHDEYWHIYYSDKRVRYSEPTLPLYYRVLSPTTITSRQNVEGQETQWHKFIAYLRGYGPWIYIKKTFVLYSDLENLKLKYFAASPKLGMKTVVLDFLKHTRNRIFNR